MTRITLAGNRYSVDVSFPLEEGVLIRLDLTDKEDDGRIVESWVKPIPQAVWKKYWYLLPQAKKIIDELFGGG